MGGFSNIWDVTVRNIEIWNGAYWFFAAFCDMWGFPFGTLAFLSGVGTLMYGFGNSLNWNENSSHVLSWSGINESNSQLITTGSSLLVFGLGVSMINLPIQILAQIMGGA